MGTDYAPLLTNLFLYSYEAEFIQNLLKDKKKKPLAKFCNIKKCGMIANETVLHKRPNDTEINNYRSPYGLQQ